MGNDTGITYDQLARNPDDYLFEKVKFRGKVVQVMEGDGITQYIHEDRTISENFMQTSQYEETYIRTILARFLFKCDDVYKPVYKLSGGERVKIALAKVFLGQYNVLLLGDPTKFLDLPTKETLQDVLREYIATILFVIHDRYLIQKLATDVLHISDGCAVLKKGNKDD